MFSPVVYNLKQVCILIHGFSVSIRQSLPSEGYLKSTAYYVPHPSYQRGGRTYCFGDGSCRRRRQTSYPLCNLNTLWNILMILGRNVDQEEVTCHIQDWQLWLSYFRSYHPLFYLKKISCPLYNSNTLWNILIVLSRNVEQDQTTCHVQE